MIPVGFSFGSNLGDKVEKIRAALDLLHARHDVVIEKASLFYETEPWGVKNQDWFMNVCAIGQTSLKPHRLLSVTQSIERELGRSKTIRWGPRIIDVDVLFYGNEAVDTEDLVIPHKSMRERAFVLVPLQEIFPDFRLGDDTIANVLNRLSDDASKVIRTTQTRWLPGV